MPKDELAAHSHLIGFIVSRLNSPKPGSPHCDLQDGQRRAVDRGDQQHGGGDQDDFLRCALRK